MRLNDIVAAVLDAVSIPVVAAGGIATPDAVAQIIAAGADAVRIGTCFVAADESAAHPAYRAALGAASGPLDTVLTTHFDQDWPDAPHRVLTTALTRAEITGNRRIDPPNRDTTGDVSDMAMYAGEGVGAVHQVSSTREIAHELMSGLVLSRSGCYRDSTINRIPVRSSPSMLMSMNDGMQTRSRPPGAT